MVRKSTLSEYRLFLLGVVAVSLVVIAGGGYALSRSKVEISVDKLLKDSEQVAPQKEPEKTDLELLWEQERITEDLGPLAKPLTRWELESLPLKLSQKRPRFLSPYLKLSIQSKEKTHKMGNNDKWGISLSLKNRTGDHLAFRVVTSLGDGFVECKTKKYERAHHAFLLKPGETFVRFEGCAFTRKVSLRIVDFQILKLPKAAHITLSRVLTPLGLPRRLEKSHKPYKTIQLSPCSLLADKERLNKRIAKKPKTWFELLDFLARNDCAKAKLP